MEAPDPLRFTSSSMAGVRKGFTIRLSAAIVRENRMVEVSRSHGPQITCAHRPRRWATAAGGAGAGGFLKMS